MKSELSEQIRRVGERAEALQGVALEPHALTVGEWRVLAALYGMGAVAPSTLAARLGLTRGGVTRLVDRLRARRLIVRSGSGGGDRRYQTLALTGGGAVLVERIRPDIAAADAAWSARLGAADRARLAALLALLDEG